VAARSLASRLVDQYLGEIRLVAFNFEPQGWAFCDGRLLPINQNQALFSLLGTYYGGDGRTTFALPDLRGRVPVGVVEPNYEIGSTGGAETVKLGVAQLPGHSHPVRGNSASGAKKDPTGAVPGKGGAYAATQNAKLSSIMLGKTGGGQAHENRQPYLSLSFIIALTGIFPSRN
jgi:microcystin-dependent protein